VFLYVGRLSYEKNLEDFLRLDLPGSKVVYGVGPLADPLRRRYPAVHWRGVVPRERLPAIYSAADAFVLPSRSETFGLVMLEAMACGTPVAAYPEAGPLDVVGPHGDGGVLDADLRAAALAALRVPREQARGARAALRLVGGVRPVPGPPGPGGRRPRLCGLRRVPGSCAGGPSRAAAGRG
jgi:glycosyltransferase involved in cell wall biosynthesis